MYPVIKQPSSADESQWVQLSSTSSGLDSLAQFKELFILQQVRALEALTAWERPNKYVVKTASDEIVFKAIEATPSTCMLYCGGAERGFTIHFIDKSEKEIFRMVRDFHCCVGCCWCADGSCGMEIKVQTPEGHPLGTVRQHTSCCAPYYKVYDQNQKQLFALRGPVCVCQDCCLCVADVDLHILTAEENNTIGRIYKRWNGCKQECLHRTLFGLEVPQDMDVKAKALLLGAVFLFDFMFFEYNGDGGGAGY